MFLAVVKTSLGILHSTAFLVAVVCVSVRRRELPVAFVVVFGKDRVARDYQDPRIQELAAGSHRQGA